MTERHAGRLSFFAHGFRHRPSMQNAVKPGVLPTRLPVLRGGLRCRASEAYLRPLPKFVPSLTVRPWLCYLQLDDMAFSSLALKNRFSAKLPLLKWSVSVSDCAQDLMGLLLVLLIVRTCS